MDKQQQDKMIDFIIENKIKLGDTLQDVIDTATSELTKGSTNQEEFEFHTAVKEEASARLRKETRLERFPEVVSRSMEYDQYYTPTLSDEEIMKMLQDEYDRGAYLDPTDNIDL